MRQIKFRAFQEVSGAMVRAKLVQNESLSFIDERGYPLMQLGDQQLTTAEVAQRSGLDRHLVAKRMPDAEKRGFVRRALYRECSVSGRDVLVWERTGKKLPTE